jgi:hypothetical protein
MILDSIRSILVNCHPTCTCDIVTRIPRVQPCAGEWSSRGLDSEKSEFGSLGGGPGTRGYEISSSHTR